MHEIPASTTSALWVCLYEHPACQAPHPSFFFFSFFLPGPFLLFDRAAGFLPPRPRIVAAGARRFCQGWPLFSGHPSGAPAFTAIEHDGRLGGSGRLLLSVTCDSVFVLARYSDHGCAFGRSCYEVHGACDVRINLYPAAPIRLAKVLLAWTIAQEGWDSSFERQIGKCRFAMQTHSHTSDPPDTPDWGCRNSAHYRRYRVRVAPCGTRPCSR